MSVSGNKNIPRQCHMECLGVLCDCLDGHDWFGCHGDGSISMLGLHWTQNRPKVEPRHDGTTSLVVRIWADSVQDLCKGSVQWASEVFQMIDGMYKVGFEALGQGG